MKCSSCAAPIERGQHICKYCGSANDIDLSGTHYFTAHIPEQKRLCPCCHENMETLNLRSSEQPFFIERCRKCMSLFFDPGELDALINTKVETVYSIDPTTLASLANTFSSEQIVYRKCPVCSKIMNRVNFGKSSGVIIDECQLHGVYLDPGELLRILQWTRAGGMLRSESNAAYEADREMRNAMQQQRGQERLTLDQRQMEEDWVRGSDTTLGKIGAFLVRWII